MTSPFHISQQTALDTLRTSAAVSISYHRGADSVTLDAVPGSSTHEAADDYGAIVSIESHDFLVAATDLVLSSVQVEPERGDQIHHTLGTTTYLYDVLPFGADRRTHRFSDPLRSTIRVHTKSVGTQ